MAKAGLLIETALWKTRPVRVWNTPLGGAIEPQIWRRDFWHKPLFSLDRKVAKAAGANAAGRQQGRHARIGQGAEFP
jgi:hypothetical protein